MIRAACEADLDAIVTLAEARRLQYETYQPTFWGKAQDSREKQLPFLAAQLQRENVIALVHETNGQIDGFLIATLVMAPPVYTAGLTCSVDDYCVAAPDLWLTVGAALLDDHSYTIASEGWTRPL